MRHANWAMTGLAGVALLLLAVQANAADAPEIVVEASASEIFIGESVDYAVEIRNVENPPPPDLSALRPDFDVVSTGDESRNQSSTFIFNGTVTQQTKLRSRLPFPPDAEADGQAGHRGPVRDDRRQDRVGPRAGAERHRSRGPGPGRPRDQDGSRESLSHAAVRGDAPRAGPPLAGRPRSRPSGSAPPAPSAPRSQLGRSAGRIDRLTTGSAGSRSSSRRTAVGFTLNDVTTQSGSFFEGPRLAVFNLYQGRESRNGLDGRPVNYFVYELKRKLTAEKAGTYALGPAIVKGSFVDGMEGNSYTGRRLVAVAPAVPVEVREVPVPRPATFCGGIGNYRLAASASPTALRVGDPLTLTLDIERGPASGSLDLISAPDLTANPQIAADFEILDKHPTGRSEGEVKRFEYALRPKRAGVGIPALAVTVFDPDTEKFSEIATRPTALAVSAASRLGAGDVVGSLARFRDTGDQVAGAGDFSKRDRSLGTERPDVSTSSRWPGWRRACGAAWGA